MESAKYILNNKLAWVI